MEIPVLRADLEAVRQQRRISIAIVRTMVQEILDSVPPAILLQASADLDPPRRRAHFFMGARIPSSSPSKHCRLSSEREVRAATNRMASSTNNWGKQRHQRKAARQRNYTIGLPAEILRFDD